MIVSWKTDTKFFNLPIINFFFSFKLSFLASFAYNLTQIFAANTIFWWLKQNITENIPNESLDATLYCTQKYATLSYFSLFLFLWLSRCGFFLEKKNNFNIYNCTKTFNSVHFIWCERKIEEKIYITNTETNPQNWVVLMINII